MAGTVLTSEERTVRDTERANEARRYRQHKLLETVLEMDAGEMLIRAGTGKERSVKKIEIVDNKIILRG